jgi:hypothetical protein
VPYELKDVLIHVLGNAVWGCWSVQASALGQRAGSMGLIGISVCGRVKISRDGNFARLHCWGRCMSIGEIRGECNGHLWTVELLSVLYVSGPGDCEALRSMGQGVKK